MSGDPTLIRLQAEFPGFTVIPCGSGYMFSSLTDLSAGATFVADPSGAGTWEAVDAGGRGLGATRYFNSVLEAAETATGTARRRVGLDELIREAAPELKHAAAALEHALSRVGGRYPPEVTRPMRERAQRMRELVERIEAVFPGAARGGDPWIH